MCNNKYCPRIDVEYFYHAVIDKRYPELGIACIKVLCPNLDPDEVQLAYPNGTCPVVRLKDIRIVSKLEKAVYKNLYTRGENKCR